jgi:hypothetical protein
VVRRSDFNPSVPLPPGLTTTATRKAIEYIEQELTGLVEIYFEQANVFSAIVGIYGAKALDIHSIYEKHRHLDLAQQRFPDLRRRGSGPTPGPNDSLESKGSKRPWALQSHYDHPGWYIVWRYLIDPTRSLDGQIVVLWRVDVTFVERTDWKYEGSTAGSAGGGRTHTFGLRSPYLKLKDKGVYQRSDVRILGGKPLIVNGDG